MNLIKYTSLFFAVVYVLIAAHYLSYDKKVDENSYELSTAFKSKEYKEFIYAK